MLHVYSFGVVTHLTLSTHSPIVSFVVLYAVPSLGLQSYCFIQKPYTKGDILWTHYTCAASPLPRN